MMFWQNCTRIVICGVCLLLLTSCGSEKNNIHKLQQPKMDAHGKNIDFSNYKGKWVIVNYWAAWCKPCLHEIPELNQLQKSQHQVLQIIGVSFDTISDKKIQLFAKTHHINYLMLSSLPTEQLGIGHVKALPATFIFNPQGKLFKTIYGEVTQASIEKVVFSTEKG